MKQENSKTNETHKSLLRLDLRSLNKHVALLLEEYMKTV